MPSPFSGIIQDMRARDARATTQQDAMMRMMEMRQRAAEAERFRQQMTLYQNQNSPAAVAERRRREMWDKKLQLQEADMRYVLGIDPNNIDAYWRPILAQTKSNLLSPNADPNVAARFISAYKPSGLKYFFKDSTDAAGNTVTTAIAVDPMSPRSVAPMSGFGATAPMGGGSGTRPSVAAPPSRLGSRDVTVRKSRAEAAADHFMAHPDFAPPDLPGVGAPSVPEVPE